MEIGRHWERIRKLFNKSFQSTIHYAAATVNEDGSPRVTPIGGLILHRGEHSGFFPEIFSTGMTRNLNRNPRICFLAVDSSPRLWLESLIRGKFVSPPGVRLVGTVGMKREATAEETQLILDRIRSVRWYLSALPFSRLRGYGKLWGKMKYVRDVRFSSFEPINAGEMSQGLWNG